ncbi:MAG: hypothetical protein LIP23_10645 [Planctomycetes bacterium]|nr:hypothetical protein [Planctomycetota bacterium]
MAELSKTVDADGMTKVKLNKDGSYEIASTCNSANAERAKANIAQAFSNDETLTSLIKKYQARYQSSLNANGDKPDAGSEQNPSSRATGSENGDKAEISDEARALLENAAASRPSEEKGDGQSYQFTMKIDMDTVEANEPPVALANRYFFKATTDLQKAAEETGEFENDFIIRFDKNNNLYIADVTGRSGAVVNDKTDAEKSRIESFLDSINEKMKNDPGETDSELVKTLRRFIEVAGRADASQQNAASATGNYYKLPFTIWGSTTRG